MRQETNFRLMTYNLGGGRKDFGSVISDIVDLIKKTLPDILVIQEATEYDDADGVRHSIVDRIAETAGFGTNCFFGKTLSMREHMHVQRAILVNGIFNDWRDWRHGNAMFSRSGFVRLGDVLKPGMPRDIPLYLPSVYRGNRDTDPRYAVIGRVNKPPIFPFVVGVHLATLVGERACSGGSRPLPGKQEEAQILRFKQARRVLNLLEEHVLRPREVVFLLGDFNAVVSEPSISSVLETEGGFKRLIPVGAQVATHPKAVEPIDHIFVYPSGRLIEYRCWIEDSPVARRASDHLPVVADVVISHS
jgi:endonuclease/exonuclease/phosphatase family metal-dependent hydrolase